MGLEVGLLRVGDPADFIQVEDLVHFKVLATYIDGNMVAQDGKSLMSYFEAPIINNFDTSLKEVADFHCPPEGTEIQVIKAINGEIVTESFMAPARIEEGNTISDTDRDILKICVVNRYSDQPPAIAFIHNFNLNQGAIASCVGHDSHNIIAVGCDDASICKAVNLIIEQKGGISAVSKTQQKVLPLPVAGIMSNEEGTKVANHYSLIDQMTKEQLGCTLSAPFYDAFIYGTIGNSSAQIKR